MQLLLEPRKALEYFFTYAVLLLSFLNALKCVKLAELPFKC